MIDSRNACPRRFPVLLLAVCLTALPGCERRTGERVLKESGENPPGPVEHIDAKERMAATELEEVRDPVAKEIGKFRAEIRGAFDEERFEFLDEKAAELRKSGALFDNGSWKIHQFYTALGERFHTGDDGWRTDIQKYDRWLKQRPESGAAHLGLAELFTSYAWVARGTGYTNTVSDAQWKEFHQRLIGAAEVLAAGEKFTADDPNRFMVGLTVALGQGWEKPDYNALMAEAAKAAPAYWGIDVQRAYSLLPRWHGEPGDWERFAKTVADRPGGLGAEGYARIVISMSPRYGDVFRDSKASWDLTREGLKILRDKYPRTPYFMNCTALLATMARDQELAKASFDKLGDEYDKEVWVKPERFVHFRTWAETGEW